MDSPLISVIMAVYNGANTLRAAIDSILAQSFNNFEFIIIDDGSTDETSMILKDYSLKDTRISVHTRKNHGLTQSLNYGLSLARGRYIARQDADDISYPERFARQFSFMDKNTDIALLGTNSDDHYPDGHTQPWGNHTFEALQKIAYLKTPFPHSSIMMRLDTCRKLGGYDESFLTSQDMEFWMRFAQDGPIAMLEEPLIRRNISASSITYKRRWRQFYDASRARWKHNTGIRRLHILYYSLRGLALSFLPHRITRSLRKVLGK